MGFLTETLNILFPQSVKRQNVARMILVRAKKGDITVTSECMRALSQKAEINLRTLMYIKSKLEEFKLIQKKGNYHTGSIVLGKNVLKTEWDEFLTES